MYKKAIFRIVYFYQFIMSALATIVFLLIPITKEKLNYTFVGLGLFIWLIFILIYVSVAASVKNMLENKYPSYNIYYKDAIKDLASFMFFFIILYSGCSFHFFIYEMDY